MDEHERMSRKEECEMAEQIAEIEGDRLLKAGDQHGAEVAHRIAALLRARRDANLEPF